MLLDKSRLNAERGLPPPLCTLPLQFYTLPIALSTVCNCRIIRSGNFFEAGATGANKEGLFR